MARAIQALSGLAGMVVAMKEVSVGRSLGDVATGSRPAALMSGIPTTPTPLLRLNEVMTELGIGRTKAHALVWAGDLSVVRIGRAIRVRRSDLDAYIETNLSRKSSTATTV